MAMFQFVRKGTWKIRGKHPHPSTRESRNYGKEHNISIQQFLDQDFSVNELKDYINRFNADNGTDITVGGQESVDTMVKGSYILGPKIGQGFYQNIQ